MVMRAAPWVTRGMIGIVVATFFSDVGHEMVTATLPLYLAGIGLGAGALGFMEGFADLSFSLSKLAGGWVGHHSDHKRAWGSLGYLATAVGTAALATTQTLAALVSFRSAAWLGRGFRSPLRDFILADEVGSTHFGRAYGIERAADMLGAVAGPLIAALLLWLGVDVHTVILVSVVPSLLAVATFFTMTREKPRATPTSAAKAQPLPRRFWLFVGAAGVFGLGDFSRTFLILLAVSVFGTSSAEPGGAAGVVSVAVLLYAAHNVVSAIAAYPAGFLADHRSKLGVLVGGYALGVVTNGVLAFGASTPALLVVAVVTSGIYIAVEETVEKAAAAEMLSREQRSLGLGILASANALGDMLSSVFVGALLAMGHTALAFVVPASVGAVGTLLMTLLAASRAKATS